MRVVFIFFVLCVMSLGLKAQDNLIVFDGSAHTKGKGFALPRGISKLEESYKRPHTNEMHLEFEGAFRHGWTGFGWNWKAWKGKGTDLSAYKNMVFHIAVSPFKMSDMNIQLTSKNKDGQQDDMGPKVSILPAIIKRGKYIKIIIPLKKLFGDNLDKTAVWGFNIGAYSHKTSKASNFRVFIDQIEFTQ